MVIVASSWPSASFTSMMHGQTHTKLFLFNSGRGELLKQRYRRKGFRLRVLVFHCFK